MKPYIAAVAVVGGSGSGKTSLISGALPHLAGAGGRIAVIKHAGHGYDLTERRAAGNGRLAVDAMDKDSSRFLRAGAVGVILVGPERLAIITAAGDVREELFPAGVGRGPAMVEHAVERAGASFDEPDLIIVEGFRDSLLPKVFVVGGRAKSFSGAVWGPDRYPAGVLALGVNASGGGNDVPAAIPRFPVDDGAAWADFLGALALRRQGVGRAAGAASLSGVILAGGQSSRLGRNKAFLDFDGRPLIARMAEILRPLVSEVVVVASESEPYRPYVDRVVPDVIPGLGPLGGIHAGLLAVRTRAAFFVGCDLPFVPGALFERLSREVARADAVVPFVDGEYEPLVAAYARSCLPAVERVMAAGHRRVVSFYPHVRLTVIADREVRSFGDPKRLFFNLNSEAEYQRALALCGSD